MKSTLSTTTTARQRRSQRGQNLVEFAMLFPFVMVFIAAIVIFGLALSARSSVQQAVREGARQAAVGATLSEVQTLAAGNAPDWIDNPAWVHWCHPLNADTNTRGKVGDPVQVYVFKTTNPNSGEGVPFTIVPSNGIFSAFGAGSLVVRLNPKATARLEKSVPNASIDTTCND
jgi:Flp pilus assembly protein TadG